MAAILNINVKCKCMSYQNCKKIYYEIKTLQHWIKGHLQVNNNYIPRPIYYQIWCGFWNQFFFGTHFMIMAQFFFEIEQLHYLINNIQP